MEYINNRNVIIKFINVEVIKTCTLQNLRNGWVSPDVLGHKKRGNGINYLRKRARNKYKGVYERCYSERYLEKHPTYRDCEVSENFKDFEYFYAWCLKQVGFENENWALDKDILVKGNKIYSEDTCCFVPHELNILVNLQKTSRGNLPVGVCYHNLSDTYQARIKVDGKCVCLGYFHSSEIAFRAYKNAKEAYIKCKAEKWKDEIDPKVYEALVNWSVEITD